MFCNISYINNLDILNEKTRTICSGFLGLATQYVVYN